MSAFLKVCYGTLVAGVFVLSVIYLRGGPEATGNIRVLSRLDEYTKASNPTIPNTIPTFLMQAGSTGVLAGEPTRSADNSTEAPIPLSAISPLNEAEVRKGFCTARLTTLVRQQYPGTYDSIPDAELEKSVLKLHPEYRDRLCVLPVWVEATPHDIVKYVVVQQSRFAVPSAVLLWASLITAGVAIAVLVVYNRLSA